MRLGEELKRLRESVELTQEALARKAGVSVGNVRNWEQGLRLPSYSAVVKLCAALGTDCTAFAGCDDVTGEAAEQPGKQSKAKK
jgi:transcriptional regulator with XRE-family HTH domain